MSNDSVVGLGMWVVSVYCSERREFFLWREDAVVVVRVLVGE